MSSTTNFTTFPLLTLVAPSRIIEGERINYSAMAEEKRNQLLGDYIRQRRLSRGLTVTDASTAAGIDHTFWRKLEAGKYESPSPKALVGIARALDAPLEDLYGLSGFQHTTALPSFTPYLRSRYQLPPEAVAQLESYFDFLRHQYGIPTDRSVFPARTAGETAKGSTSDPASSTGDSQAVDAGLDQGAA